MQIFKTLAVIMLIGNADALRLKQKVAQPSFEEAEQAIAEAFDHNGDGEVSRKEFKKTVRSHLPEGMSKDEIKDVMQTANEIFNFIDADNSGAATLTELHAAFDKRPPTKEEIAAAQNLAQVRSTQPGGDHSLEDIVDAVFDMLDEDANGQISRKEVKQALKDHLPEDMTKEEREEARDEAMEVFNLIDADGSGGVSKAELHAGLKAMMEDPELRE